MRNFSRLLGGGRFEFGAIQTPSHRGEGMFAVRRSNNLLEISLTR